MMAEARLIVTIDGFEEALETMTSAITAAEIRIRDLEATNAELMANLTATQNRCNKLVNASPQRTVGAFMVMSEQPTRTTPQVPDDDEVRLRLRLIAEEFFELLEASVDLHGYSMDLAKESVSAIFENGTLKVDLPAFADALADLRYVIHGTDLAFGIDGRKIDALVHAANMAKRDAGKDASGKWQKPKGWQPPDIEGELVRQGWTRKGGAA